MTTVTDADVQRAEQDVIKAATKAQAAATFAEQKVADAALAEARWHLQRVEQQLTAQRDQDVAWAASRQAHADDIAAMRTARKASRADLASFLLAARQTLADLADAIRRDNAEIDQDGRVLAEWGLRIRDGAGDDVGADRTAVVLDGVSFGHLPADAVLLGILHQVQVARLGRRSAPPLDWRVGQFLAALPPLEKADLPQPLKATPAPLEGAPVYLRHPRGGQIVNAKELTAADLDALKARDPAVQWSAMSESTWRAIREEAGRSDPTPSEPLEGSGWRLH